MRRLRHGSLIGATIVVLLLLVSGEAHACPDCSTARVVRASVFDGGDFWTHLFLITLPLIVLALISILLYRVGLERPRPSGTPNTIHVKT